MYKDVLGGYVHSISTHACIDVSIVHILTPQICRCMSRWVPTHALYHHRIAMQNTYGGNLRKYYALGAYSLIYTIYRYIRYILVI